MVINIANRQRSSTGGGKQPRSPRGRLVISFRAQVRLWLPIMIGLLVVVFTFMNFFINNTMSRAITFQEEEETKKKHSSGRTHCDRYLHRNNTRQVLQDIAHNNNKIQNVMVMGQFNFAVDAASVVVWFNSWRSIFEHVSARGEWSDTEVSHLISLGLDVYKSSRNDKGFNTPIENLARTLQQQQQQQNQSSSNIDGVLYIHDDMLIDLSKFLDNCGNFRTENIIGSSTGKDIWPYAYKDPISLQNFSDGHGYTFQVKKDGQFTNFIMHPKGTSRWQDLQLKRPGWWSPWPPVIRSIQRIHNDERSHRYRLNSTGGNLVIPSPSQADMLFVPTRCANEFIAAANLMVDNNVWLEIGFDLAAYFTTLTCSPSISIETIPLCTTWAPGVRGKVRMIDYIDISCDAFDNYGESEYGMYHPIKISFGNEMWSSLFRQLALGDPDFLDNRDKYISLAATS